MISSPEPNIASDPKCRIFDIKRFSLEDGPGIRTVVFFSGCPLACPWCHNPEGRPGRSPVQFYQEHCIGCLACRERCPLGLGQEQCGKGACTGCNACVNTCFAGALRQPQRGLSIQEILSTILLDLGLYIESGGGVTASGGEPLEQMREVTALFRACREQGIHTLLETSGCGSQDPKALLEVTDQVYLDLKSASEAQYCEIHGDLGQVLQFAQAVLESGVPLTMRTPMIPGVNDGYADLLAMAEITRRFNAPWVLLPFNPWARQKYRALGLPYREYSPRSKARLQEIVAHLGQKGVSVELG